jgi:hypothetical protein
MATQPTGAASFDYAALPAADARWLQEATGAIRNHARSTATSIIHIGEWLNQIRDRLGRGTWGRWLDKEFSWSRKKAVRHMQVADAFGGAAGEKVNRFEPSALYVLAEPQTPPQARELALQHAAEGRRITHAFAREIMNSCRQVKVTDEDVKELVQTPGRA